MTHYLTYPNKTVKIGAITNGWVVSVSVLNNLTNPLGSNRTYHFTSEDLAGEFAVVALREPMPSTISEWREFLDSKSRVYGAT